jgi:hypothetical protein
MLALAKHQKFWEPLGQSKMFGGLVLLIASGFFSNETTIIIIGPNVFKVFFHPLFLPSFFSLSTKNNKRTKIKIFIILLKVQKQILSIFY